jgi:hypothetical protein
MTVKVATKSALKLTKGWLSLPLGVAVVAFFPVFGIYFSGEDFVFIYSASADKPFYSPTQNLFYRPLPNLFWQLDYRLWGLEASGYHFTNLLLHLINTALVSLLAHQIFPKAVGNAALIAGILFAVQPAHVEPVVWLAARPDLLATLFFLLSLISGLRFFLPVQELKNSYWLIISLLAFGLGLFSKENAIALPIVLFLWLLLNYPRREWLKLIAFAILYGLVVIFYVLIRLQALGGWGGYPSEGNELFFILWNSTLGFWLPLLFPINLAQSGLLLGIILAAIFGLIYLCLFILAWRNKANEKGRREWLFGLLVFYAGLLPAVNIASVSPGLEQSRILYLPSVGFCLLLTWLFNRLVSHPAKWFLLFAMVTIGLVTVFSNTIAWQKAGEGVRQTLTGLKNYQVQNQIKLQSGDTIYYEGLPDAYNGAYLWRNGLDEATKILINREITGIHRLENVIVDYRIGRLWFFRFPNAPKENYTVGAGYFVGGLNTFNDGETIQNWQLNNCKAEEGFPNDLKAGAGQGLIRCEIGKGIQFVPGAKASLDLDLPLQNIAAKTLYLDLSLYMNFDFQNPQALCEVFVSDSNGRKIVDYFFDIAANGRNHQYRLVLPVNWVSPLQISLRVNKIRSNLTWQRIRLSTPK